MIIDNRIAKVNKMSIAFIRLGEAYVGIILPATFCISIIFEFSHIKFPVFADNRVP